MIRTNDHKNVRIALFGCGRVAQRIHAPLLARLPGSELVAVADPSADAKSVARRWNPDVCLFDSVDELLDAGGFDAACVCLPTHLHAQYASRLIEMGIPVYLEKPIATTEHEASLLLSAWRDRNVHAMVGFNYRFHPVHRAVGEILRSGSIGRLTAVRTLFATPARALPQWKRSRTSGGGALLDLLSHHADLVMHHTGERAESISATVRSVYSEDDNAAATWLLSSGVIVHSTVSMTGAETDRIEYIGEVGSVVADRIRGTVLRASQSHSATTPEMVARSIGLAWRQLGSFRPRLDPSFAPALRAFVDSVRTNTPPKPDLGDGWNSLAVVLGAAESASRESVQVQVAYEPTFSGNCTEQDLPPAVREQINVVDQDSHAPMLSVVLVTINGMASLGRVMSFLQKQSIAHQIQLLIVAPDEETLRLGEDSKMGSFHSCDPVCVGPIDDIDQAAALALEFANAEYVTFLEDHAFPEPEWAERIIEATHAGQWDAIGTRIENGNPGSVLSWANMLMSYGKWVAAEFSGTTLHVARHNTTFRRATLDREYGHDLPSKMGRDGGLLNDLLSRGATFYLTPATCVEHLNPSTWGSTLELRIGSGRLFAASRMKHERWSKPKRLMYIVFGAAIPLIRFRLLQSELFASSVRRERIGWKAYPALVVGVTLDGLGQFLGHTLGPGKIKQKLAHFEISRARHLRRSERHLMSEAKP